VRAIIFFTF